MGALSGQPLAASVARGDWLWADVSVGTTATPNGITSRLTPATLFTALNASDVTAALGYTPENSLAATAVLTIAALRTVGYAALANGAVVQVAGYYSTNDGGGGAFLWNSTSVATDDSGTIINPTGNSGAGRFLRLGLTGSWDWKWFGAVGGNGTHDDTTAIQACYTAAGAWMAANSFGGAQRVEIVPSAGLYLISSTINITASDIITRAPTIEGAGVISNSATADHFYINNGASKVTNVWFVGIIFQRSVTATAGFAIDFNYVYSCGVVGCRVYGNNQQYNGINFTSALQCHIRENRVEATIAEAIVLQGQSGTGMFISDIYLRDNSFAGCNSGEPAVTGGSAPRGVVTLKDYAGGIFFNPTNEIYGHRGWAIKLYGTITAGTAGNELVFIDHPNIDGGSTAITTGLGAGAIYMSDFNGVQITGGWAGSTNLDAVYIDAGCNGIFISDMSLEPQNNAGASILGNGITINSALVTVQECILNGGNISLGVPFNILSSANYLKLLDNDVEQFTSAAAIYSAPSGWGASATYEIRPGITILNGSAVIAANLAVIPFTTTPTGAISANWPDSTALGGNARGAQAVDLQMVRNAGTQVASGAQSVILGGSSNTATGQYACAGGAVSFGNAEYAFAYGHNAAATARAAVSIGEFTNAAGQYGAAFGGYSYDRGNYGTLAFASGDIATSGDSQLAFSVLRGARSTAGTMRLSADGNSAGSANVVNLPTDNLSYVARVETLVKNEANGDAAVFYIDHVLIQRGTGASSVTVNGGTTSISMTAGTANGTLATGISAAIQADTTNGGLAVNVTQTGSLSLHACATVMMTQCL